MTTFFQLSTRLKNFFRGWLLVLGLKEGLVECATVCVKSVVILEYCYVTTGLFCKEELEFNCKSSKDLTQLWNPWWSSMSYVYRTIDSWSDNKDKPAWHLMEKLLEKEMNICQIDVIIFPWASYHVVQDFFALFYLWKLWNHN